MNEANLPRLLYLGDVPVESSYHGSALLYRLLQGYPADRLRIVEANFSKSQPDRRLPAVAYRALDVGCARLMHTRFHEWYSVWLSSKSTAWARLVPAVIDDFRPDAVLTVAHGYLWITAAEFARCNQLPLHLIVHDDWPRVACVPKPFRAWLDRQFGRVYRAASSRFCVSPFMAREYCRRYGVEGQVLFPARACDVKAFAAPPQRLRDRGRGTVFAFAGTINTPDYYRLLRLLAECLEPLGGRVLIFGPLTADEAISVGLNKSNVEVCGLLKSSELIERLRADVDVLFVPMSFAVADRPNMEVSFPSKLVDYTAVGLPLLIMGPPYCSAVRWARENPGVAEIVDTDETEVLNTAVQRLAADTQHRMNLAAAALSGGIRFFSHGSARSTLLGALQPSHLA